MRGAGVARRVATGAMVAALGFGVAGCGDGETTFTTEDGTVTIDGNGDSGTITIDSSEGSMTLSGEAGGDLPDGWPRAVQLPEGGTIVSSGSFTVQGGDSWQAAVTYADRSAQQVSDELKSSMQDAGFTVESALEADEQSAVNYTGNGWTVTAVSSESDGTATLVVGIAPAT